MINFIRKMLQVTIEDALMPTGKNLVPTLVFACSITVINIGLRLFGWPCALDWRGGVLAVVVLIALLVIERSEYDAVSKLYRDVELRVKDIKSKQQAGRSRKQDERGADMPDEPASNAECGADTRPTDRGDNE